MRRVSAGRFSFLTHGTFGRIQWSAVLAGVACALAVHVVLGLFVSAIAAGAAAADSAALGWLAGLFGLAVPFAASFVGASVAVRGAQLLDVGSTYLHGVLVWCFGLLAGAVFLGLTAGGASAVGAGARYSFDAAALGDRVGAATAGGFALAGLAALVGLGGAVVGAASGRRSAIGRYVDREEETGALIGDGHAQPTLLERDTLGIGAQSPSAQVDDLPPTRH